MQFKPDFVNRALTLRLDRASIIMLAGVAICLNSCSAISTFEGLSGLCFPLAVLACIALLLLPDYETGNPTLTVGVLVFALPIALSCVGNLSYSNIVNSINLLAVIMLAYLCVRKFGPQKFCKAFVSLMCATSAFSLLLSVLSNVGIDLPLPVFENINGAHYKTIGIASLYEENFIQRGKSMGFFWESGIFASYLLLAMAVEFMIEERASKYRLALLSAALITTYSTAGYLLVPLVFSVGLLKRGGRARIVISIGLLVVFMVGVVNLPALIDVLQKISPSLFDKLTDADAVTRLTRLQSPGICLDLFSQSPLIGLGYGGALDAYSANVSSIASIDSLTTTSFFQLAAFGLAGFAMWGVTAYSLLGACRLPFFASLTFALLFAIIINKEPHTASALAYALIFSFLAFANEEANRSPELRNGNARGECPYA